MTDPSVFSCVLPLAPGARGALADTLALAQFEEEATRAVLSQLPELHFMRCSVLDAGRDADGHYLSPALLVSTWYDGELEQHLGNLACRARPLLERVLPYCEVAARGSEPLQAALREGSRPQRVRTLASFNAAPRQSARQIQLEAALLQQLRCSASNYREQAPEVIYRELYREARADPALRWVFEPAARPGVPRPEQARRWLFWLLKTAPRWALFWLSLPALRRAEHEHRARTVAASLPVPAASSRPSPHATQNAYTLVSTLRPGAVSRRTLRLFLELVHVIASMRADLSGIATIRCAHWAELDAGRRLLFCSVYDGPWDAYMSDLIALVGWGLTGVWGHSVGFPPADWLVLNGARHEQAMRRFAHEHTAFTPFWYRAYPGSSNYSIAAAARVRRGMQTAPDGREELRAWLSAL